MYTKMNSLFPVILFIITILLMEVHAKPQMDHSTMTPQINTSSNQSNVDITFDYDMDINRHSIVNKRSQVLRHDYKHIIPVRSMNGSIFPVYTPIQDIISATDSPSTSNSEERRRGKRDNIIFPDEAQFIPKAFENCSNGLTYCVSADSYPESHVESILNEHSIQYTELFGEDIIETRIKNRIGDETGYSDELEESLCESQEDLIYPKIGESIDRSWKYIVNTERYVQGIRVEKCVIKDTNQCSSIANFPNNYRAECKQKYIYRQLLAINNKGLAKKELFKIPSCCQCVLKSSRRT